MTTVWDYSVCRAVVKREIWLSSCLFCDQTTLAGSLQADAADYFLHIDAGAVHPGGDEVGCRHARSRVPNADWVLAMP